MEIGMESLTRSVSGLHLEETQIVYMRAGRGRGILRVASREPENRGPSPTASADSDDWGLPSVASPESEDWWDDEPPLKPLPVRPGILRSITNPGGARRRAHPRGHSASGRHTGKSRRPGWENGEAWAQSAELWGNGPYENVHLSAQAGREAWERVHGQILATAITESATDDVYDRTTRRIGEDLETMLYQGAGWDPDRVHILQMRWDALLQDEGARRRKAAETASSIDRTTHHRIHATALEYGDRVARQVAEAVKMGVLRPEDAVDFNLHLYAAMYAGFTWNAATTPAIRPPHTARDKEVRVQMVRFRSIYNQVAAVEVHQAQCHPWTPNETASMYRVCYPLALLRLGNSLERQWSGQRVMAPLIALDAFKATGRLCDDPTPQEEEDYHARAIGEAGTLNTLVARVKEEASALDRLGPEPDAGGDHRIVTATFPSTDVRERDALAGRAAAEGPGRPESGRKRTVTADEDSRGRPSIKVNVESRRSGRSRGRSVKRRRSASRQDQRSASRRRYGRSPESSPGRLTLEALRPSHAATNHLDPRGSPEALQRAQITRPEYDAHPNEPPPGTPVLPYWAWGCDHPNVFRRLRPRGQKSAAELEKTLKGLSRSSRHQRQRRAVAEQLSARRMADYEWRHAALYAIETWLQVCLTQAGRATDRRDFLGAQQIGLSLWTMMWDLRHKEEASPLWEYIVKKYFVNSPLRSVTRYSALPLTDRKDPQKLIGNLESAVVQDAEQARRRAATILLDSPRPDNHSTRDGGPSIAQPAALAKQLLRLPGPARAAEAVITPEGPPPADMPPLEPRGAPSQPGEGARGTATPIKLNVAASLPLSTSTPRPQVQTAFSDAMRRRAAPTIPVTLPPQAPTDDTVLLGSVAGSEADVSVGAEAALLAEHRSREIEDELGPDPNNSYTLDADEGPVVDECLTYWDYTSHPPPDQFLDAEDEDEMAD